LQDGEEAALVNAASAHLRDCITVALATAMRKNEILSLQWKQVRWLQNEIYLPAAKTKSKQDRTIPISLKPAIREILTRRQTGLTRGQNPVSFTFEPDHFVFGDEAGGRITSIKTAWESAVLRAHGVRSSGRAAGCQPRTERSSPR
jgi:integrase